MDDDELTAVGIFMWVLIAIAIAGVVVALLLGPA